MSKLGAVLVCLLFAIPFGGIGAGASWAVYRMIEDSHRAQDWVRVKATVDSFDHGKVEYHYTFRGREYRGDRMGVNPLGGTDNIDSWHDDKLALFTAAKAEGKPITVWMNPEQPSQSMVDRDVRWKLVLFALPFALGFGGVGVGALFVMLRTLFKREAPAGTVAPARGASASQGLGAMWAFAIMWNVIAFPIAMLAVPEAVSEGDWIVLIVMLFPLIGVFLLWGAITGTLRWIRSLFARGEPATAAAAYSSPGSPSPRDGFARGMIDDPRGGEAAVIDAMDTGLPAAPDPALAELEKLAGKKLTAEERAQLEKMSPRSREMIGKFAGWLGKMKQQ